MIFDVDLLHNCGFDGDSSKENSATNTIFVVPGSRFMMKAIIITFANSLTQQDLHKVMENSFELRLLSVSCSC